MKGQGVSDAQVWEFFALFHNEEIDTTVIEEEDWIEYIKRSTEDAMEKMQRAKIRCWNRTKNEMEIGTENRNITE